MKNRIHRQPFLGHSGRWVRERQAIVNAERDPVSMRMYGSGAWRTLRRLVLDEAGGRCEWPGCSALAHVVDHVKPHGGDNGRFFDRANLQALCKLHHDRKTAAHDGGFGNRRRPIA